MDAKRWTIVSLGGLILATQWADLLWPVLLIAGVEQVAIEPGITAFNALDFTHYPWSHSLLMGLSWESSSVDCTPPGNGIAEMH